MKYWKQSAALAVIALLVGVMVACEDSDLLAPSDGQIILSASPAEVIIDVDNGETFSSTQLSAQVFDSAGFPLEGVAVTFSASAGTLASQPSGQAAAVVETDENGIATDILTITIDDPFSIAVTARSATLAQALDVSWDIIPGNQLPVANLIVNPVGGQAKGQSVTFDGSGSTDPDNDALTCFKWTLQGATTEIVQGQTRSVLTRIFDTEQSVTAILQVSDDPAAFSLCGASDNPIDDAFLSPASAVLSNYDIVCDLSNPTADAGSGNQSNVSLSANGGTVTIFLDGSQSSDPQSGIDTFSWSCGNGTPAVNGSIAQCQYTSTGTFTIRLTVTNGCAQTAVDQFSVSIIP